MKKFLLSIFLILALASCSRVNTTKFNIISYNIKANYDTLSRKLSVNANIGINFSEINDNKIKLLFNNIAQISKIICSDNNNKYTIKYKYDNDTLILDLPEKLQNTNNITLNFNYNMPIDAFTNNHVFNAFRSAKWCPLIYNNLAKWYLEVQVPKNYIAYSSGNLTIDSNKENYSIYIWNYEKISGVPLIIAQKDCYTTTRKVIDNKELIFNLINKDTTTTNLIIDELCKSFHFYNSFLGTFKEKKLSIYEIPDDESFAMSLETMIIVGNKMVTASKSISNIINSNDKISFTPQGSNFDSFMVYESPVEINPMYKIFEDRPHHSRKMVLAQLGIDIPQSQPETSQDGLFWIAHEVAHQWIGIGCNIKYLSKNSTFIEEGLTEYLRFLYIEYVYGKDSLNKVIKETNNEFETIIRTGQDIPLSINSYDRITYTKGPLLFHYVRQKIGKDNFISFIRTLYSKYYGNVIDYDVFKSEFLKLDKNGRVVKRMEELLEARGRLPELNEIKN